MAVSEHITEYTATANQTPQGSDSVGTDLDDHLRSSKGNVGRASRVNSSCQRAAVIAKPIRSG